MTCEQHRERLVEALYKELSAGEQVQFDEHMSTCQECARNIRK